MLSRAELLDLAEAFAARIPHSPDYALDRSRAWRAIASGRLHIDDISSARRGMRYVEEPCLQAQLRIEAAHWVRRHPGSEDGRDLLRDTLARASDLEPWWSRRDVTELATVVALVLGIEHVETITRQLTDPFTIGNVHVTLASALSSPEDKREQLRQAEALAVSVREGDRDFALRWVFEGYRRAGLNEDAERVRHLAGMDPEELTRNERAVLAGATSVLEQSATIADRHDVDALDDRLRRFLKYDFNDLKVIFLTDAARRGELNDPAIETQLRSDTFQRIGPPRAPRLMSDKSALDADGLARFLFARPVRQQEEDRALLEGDDGCEHEHDEAAFVRTLTELFEDFGRLAPQFSGEQVEQGLWFVFGHPFWLRDSLSEPRISVEARERCVRAMIHPFRDYYLPRESSFPGSVFSCGGPWYSCELLMGPQKSRESSST